MTLSLSDQAFDRLFNQSYQLIESILNDSSISKLEKADIALKILEIAHHTKVSENTSLSIPKPEVTETIIDLPANYVKIENFLSPEEYQTALELAFANQERFFSSQVLNNAEEHRKSSVFVMKNIPDFYEMMRHKVLEVRPQVLEQLNIDPFLVSWLEMQLTAHNHGDFYKIHNDAAPGETSWNRVLTYVYYFYQEPLSFYGGNLRIYETFIQEDAVGIKDKFETIEPQNNTIVFFDSRAKHEVMPVICPSQKFEDSRFTINGWIHR
jgi:Rps23 Pro-64 3,4-dihydroxylase Tpa1-like proline 4-hydroxylase